MDRILGRFGCRIGGLGMVLKYGLLILLLGLPGMALAQTEALSLPSGQPVSRLDILFEDHPETGENWLVLRFLTPQIARDPGLVSYGQAAPDMDYLCAEIGLNAAQSFGDDVDVVVVVFLDQPLGRGVTNAAVTQFMSAYRLIDGACIWE